MSAITVALSVLAAAPQAGLQEALPAEALHASAAYTYMWWAYGLRDARKVLNIQTSRFALSFDYTNLRLTHLMPLAEPPSEAAALTQANRAVFGKPNAALECCIEADGKRFRAVAPANADFRNCHLIESGRFFQRRSIEPLTWEPGAPKTDGNLEIAAWPDRLLILLRARPAEAIRRGALHVTLRLDGLAHAQPGDRAVHAFSLPVENWPAGRERELAVVIRPADGTVRALDGAARPAKGNSPPPVRVTAKQIAPTAADLPVTYDARLGWHYVALRNDVPDNSPAGRNRRMERVALTLANSSSLPRSVRLCFGKANTFGIVGISAMLRDADGYPTGIPVQISKNWHRGRAPGRYQGPWYRALTMLTVPAKATLKLEYTAVNALWGGVPAASHAQLCLVGWGSNQLWEQAAIGSWGESICFEPDQGQRGGAVLDTRPLMVYAMGNLPKRKWSWTHNVGGADFLVYYDPAGAKQWNSRMRTRCRRNGPVLTEVTYAGRSHDEKIDLTYTVSLYRSDDITRGVYHFRYDVRRPVAFSRLVLFQCGGDDYSYTGERKFARGNADGLVQEWEATWGGNRYRTRPAELTGRVPWLSMHEAVRRKNDQGAWANRGVVIRHWDARLDGRPARPWAAERGARVRGADTSLIDILPSPDVKQLRPGDHVEAVVEHVVIPQFADDYYGPNKALAAALKKQANTWRMVLREARGNDLTVDVTVGKLVRPRPTMIRTDGGRAEFSVAGGLGYVPITLSGLPTYRGPVLQVREPDGTWATVNQADHGNDFWQTDYHPETATWDITYSVPLDTPGDARIERHFRFHVAAPPQTD